MMHVSSLRRLVPVYLLEGSNFTSGLGNSIIMITIPWLILERTDSPAFAGLVLALSAIPALLASPLSGWMVDHIGRRVVSIGADLLSAISVIAFPLFAILFGLTDVLILVLAVVGAIFDPAGYTARRTLLTDTAQAAHMDQNRLNGIHEGVFGVSWIAGPVVGAWLIAGVGAINAFWVAGGLFLFAAASLVFLRVGDAGKDARELKESEGQQEHHALIRGFIILWQDRLLRTITIAVLIIAIVYLPTESIVLPAYFLDLGQPQSLGIVIGALAGGTAIGAFAYGWISARLSQRALIRTILIGTAVSILPMALLPPLPILIASAFFLGFFWGPFNPLMSTLVQQRVSPDEQGRVFGAQLSAFYAAPPLGMVVVGLSVEQWGVQGTYIVLAATLSITSIIAVFARAIRQPSDLDTRQTSTLDQ
jgi:MFS family permease